MMRRVILTWALLGGCGDVATFPAAVYEPVPGTTEFGTPCGHSCGGNTGPLDAPPQSDRCTVESAWIDGDPRSFAWRQTCEGTDPETGAVVLSVTERLGEDSGAWPADPPLRFEGSCTYTHVRPATGESDIRDSCPMEWWLVE